MISITPSETNIDPKILEFIKSLSYDEYILAGNSVANIIENINIQGDLDFWVLKTKNYLNILEEFKNKGATSFEIYPSMIYITIPNFPLINLILSNLSKEKTVERFDFDYCRCFYSTKTGYLAFPECQMSIFNKQIIKEIKYPTIKRIIKALNYGYSFSESFWKRTGLKPDQLQQHKSENNIYQYSNIFDVDYTIVELCQHFNVSEERDTMFKIGTFNVEHYDTVIEYVKKLILYNPIQDSDYMEIHLGVIKNIMRHKFIPLNKDFFITVNYLSDYLSKYSIINFKRMFIKHPNDRHKIIINGSEVETCRWQKSYLNTPKIKDDVLQGKGSYMYSGFDSSHNNEDLPEIFKPFYGYVKLLDQRYNQCSINWYQDEKDYISLHSDCTRNMVSNASICLLSLYESDDKSNFRNLIIKDKSTKKIQQITLNHGMMIHMQGNMQNDFTHGILPSNEKQCPRISLSFRQII